MGPCTTASTPTAAGSISKRASSRWVRDAWPDSDSQVGGHRFYVTLGIHREPATENWWVTVMEAQYVEMGGRVLDTRPRGKHTATPMGSGMPACGGSRFAAAIMEYLGVGRALRRRG